MSLSVFIILLITCSNLCNCAVPVQTEDKSKYPPKNEPGHPQNEPEHPQNEPEHPQNEPEHQQKDDKHKNSTAVQVDVSALEALGFVQGNRKKKKHIENKPENVPQHVNDLQAENSAHGNLEEKEQPENKPENVPPHVDNLKNSAQGKPEKKDQTKHEPQNVPSLSNEKKPADVINSTKNVTINTASSGKPNNEIRSHKKFNHNVTEMDSSTLKRLVLVLVALSILFIMYLAFKTYRGRNRKSRMMVSKYGVRTRRSDLEMRPLPLDEEEEDETVFEVGNNR